jgi:hypothetical protein
MKQGRKILILVSCCCLLPWLSPAQEIQTNERGEKIVVFPDGTWVPYHDLNPDQPPHLNPEEASKIQAIQRAERAKARVREASATYEDAVLQRVQAEEALWETRRDDAGTDPNAIVRLEGIVLERQAVEDAASTDLKNARAWADFSRKLMEMPYKKRKKALANWEQEHAKTAPKPKPEAQPQAIPPVTAENQEKKLLAYDPALDIRFNPPVPPCLIAFDGVDEFTGKKRRDVAAQPFFSYTPPALRPYFRGKDLLTCEGALSLTQGFYFLNLMLELKGKNADKSYGLIEKGTVLSIRFLDGESIHLVNNQTDPGVYQAITDCYLYRAQYPLDASVIKKMKTWEVDKVRLFWSSGFEDYEVYELDFFKHQLRCLESR